MPRAKLLPFMKSLRTHQKRI